MPEASQPDGAIRYLGYPDGILTPDGRSEISVSGSVVTRVDLATAAVTGSWTVGQQLGGYDVTLDGRYVILAEWTTGEATFIDGRYVQPIFVHRLDLESGAVTSFQTNSAYGAFFDVVATAGGKVLLTNGYHAGAEPLSTFDVASGTFSTSTTQMFGSAGTLTASIDHSHVLLAPLLQDGAPLYDYVPGAGIVASRSGGGYVTTDVQAISNSGTFAATVTTAGAIYVLDAQLNVVTDIAQVHPEFAGTPSGTVSGLAFSADERSLYLFDGRLNEIFQLSTRDWSITGAIPLTGNGLGGALEISRDGHYLLAGSVVIDLAKVVSVDVEADNVLSGAGALYGFGGNDTLIATGLGATLIGGAGNDMYYAEGSVYISRSTTIYFPTIVERPGDGIDTLYSSLGRLDANVENLVGTSTARNILFGNAEANSITGNVGSDFIMPGPGLDRIALGGGQDVLGGTPADFAGDVATGFGVGDAVAVTSYIDFTTHISATGGYEAGSFSYARSGEALSIAGGAPLTLAGLVGGHFVQQVDYTASVFRQGYVGSYNQSSNVTLVLRANTPELSDFNGDGHADILFRNAASGDISSWSVMGNATPLVQQNSFYAAGPAASWQAEGTLDVNGDGISDLLWHNGRSGQLAVWDGTGQGGFTQSSYLSGDVATSWSVAGMGDFNGDGRDDLFWRNSSGAVSTWTSTGTSFAQNTFSAQVDRSWHVQGTGDFDGDGKADVLWRNADGSLSVWSGTAAGFAQNSYAHGPVGLGWHVAGVGDMTSDGKADILWRNDDGSVSVWTSTGSGFVDNSFGSAGADNSWHIAGLFDFNDDGRDEVLWRNDDGALEIWRNQPEIGSAPGSPYGHFVAAAYDSPVDPAWSVVTHHFDVI